MEKGFTLVELLVVMAILAILASVGFGQYRTSQQKGRDAQRKADLANIARALEMYYNDHQAYPSSQDCGGSETGKIVVNRDCPASARVLNWGDAFEINGANNEIVVYMKQLPRDPRSHNHYCYQADGSYFRLYAILENSRDRDYNKYKSGGYQCHGETFNYEITSSNVKPE